MYKRNAKGLFLKCLDKSESMKVVAKVHKEVYGSHKLDPKMRWLIHRHGYHWLTMAFDYFNYAKGCTTCQQHDPIQRLPAEELHLVIKP